MGKAPRTPYVYQVRDSENWWAVDSLSDLLPWAALLALLLAALVVVRYAVRRR